MSHLHVTFLEYCVVELATPSVIGPRIPVVGFRTLTRTTRHVRSLHRGTVLSTGYCQDTDKYYQYALSLFDTHSSENGGSAVVYGKEKVLKSYFQGEGIFFFFPSF
jgi:hypothetical protein